MFVKTDEGHERKGTIHRDPHTAPPTTHSTPTPPHPSPRLGAPGRTTVMLGLRIWALRPTAPRARPGRGRTPPRQRAAEDGRHRAPRYPPSGPLCPQGGNGPVHGGSQPGGASSTRTDPTGPAVPYAVLTATCRHRERAEDEWVVPHSCPRVCWWSQETPPLKRTNEAP